MELMGPGLARRSGFVARWAALKASEAFAALLEFARVCLKGGLAIAGSAVPWALHVDSTLSTLSLYGWRAGRFQNGDLALAPRTSVLICLQLLRG